MDIKSWCNEPQILGTIFFFLFIDRHCNFIALKYGNIMKVLELNGWG